MWKFLSPYVREAGLGLVLLLVEVNRFFFGKKAKNLLLLHDTNLFKKVVADFSAHWVSTEAELDLKVLSKAARVVISERLGVSKGLQQRVRFQNLLLDLEQSNVD